MLGGPVVKNKAHFFVSLERQVDKPEPHPRLPDPARSTSRSSRIATTGTRSSASTIRSAPTTPGRCGGCGRLAPQYPIVVNRSTLDTFQDETDLDQTAVFTFTSVLGGAKVNTFRFAKTWEHWWHGNDCSRAQGGEGGWEGFKFGEEDPSNQALCAPQLDYISFLSRRQHGNAGAVGRQLPDRGQLLVVRARQEGRPQPEVRRPLQLHRAAARVADQPERHLPVQHRSAVRPGQSAHLSRAAHHPHPQRLRRDDDQPQRRAVTRRTSGRWATGRPSASGCATTSSSSRTSNPADNPLFAPGQKTAVDKNNFSPRIGFTRQLDDSGKSLIRAGYGIFYNRTLLGAIDDTIEFPKFTLVDQRDASPTTTPTRARAAASSRPIRSSSTVRS